jgi:translation initiation factor 3 subunit B
MDFERRPLHGAGKEEQRKTPGAEEAQRKGKESRENMLAYWTPDIANQPARITLMAFPGRAIVRQKFLFSVYEVRSDRSSG